MVRYERKETKGKAYKYILTGVAVRRGETIDKQIKIRVPTKEKAQYFRSNESTKRFINNVIQANKPREKAGKKIEFSVILRYFNKNIENKDGTKGAKIDMRTSATDKPFDFDQLIELNVQGYDDSTNEYFGWNPATRDTKALHGSLYINYRYENIVGYKSEDNNCLRHALVERFGWNESKIQLYQTIVPDGEGAKVESLPDIEYYLKININVPGYHTSLMQNPVQDTVSLTLFDNHYELEEGEAKCFDSGLTHGLPEFARCPIILHKINDDETWTIGRQTDDGFKMKTINDKHEIGKLRDLHRYKKIWLCLQEPSEQLWREYNAFEQYCRNEFKSSFTRYNSIADFAVELWRTYLKKPVKGVSVHDDNMIDCIMRTGSGLVDFVPGTYENVKCYDYISFYPSLLMGNVPATKPYWGEPSNTYQKPCNDEQKEKYGLDFFVEMQQGWFHVEITEAELAKETPRRFVKSRTGYYYSDEIQMMQNKRYKFKLTERRAIIFGDCERLQLFREYYTKLFEYKKETNNIICKQAINQLLGKLASKNFSRRRITERVEINHHHDVVDADRAIYYTKNYKESKYKYIPWIQAIVLARGRMAINALIDEVGRENVVCVMTDAVFVKSGTKEPTNIGTELGQLKLEHEGTLQVNNNKTKVWVE